LRPVHFSSFPQSFLRDALVLPLTALGKSLYIALAIVSLLPGMARSQQAELEVGAQATGLVTRESPAIGGRDLTEGYLTQPLIMAQLGLWNGALEVKGTLDFEGVTLKRGELNAGIVGEGYIDRRHPHTYLHELVATAKREFGGTAISLTAGKGFAPFGTDDPMSRPFEKYPINHHLAQILERAVGIGAVRTGRLIVEGGLFNGDEPESAGDNPNRARYWDSWSARATFLPFSQGEIQASYARLKSPEVATGGGADQRKQSASIRLEDAQHSGYGLLEWAHTGEYAGGTKTAGFTSVLAETWAKYEAVSGAIRVERTQRPDEARLADPFRTAGPASGQSLLGRSRWTILTARAAASLHAFGGLSLEPFAEVARIHIAEDRTLAAFDPRQFYGSNRIWSVSVGAKLSFGMAHMRMGRYGAASTESSSAKMGGMDMPGMKMGAIHSSHD
jgi:hypothetical protein